MATRLLWGVSACSRRLLALAGLCISLGINNHRAQPRLPAATPGGTQLRTQQRGPCPCTPKSIDMCDCAQTTSRHLTPRTPARTFQRRPTASPHTATAARCVLLAHLCFISIRLFHLTQVAVHVVCRSTYRSLRCCPAFQASFGDMIGCDNPDCPIEWFHDVRP